MTDSNFAIGQMASPSNKRWGRKVSAYFPASTQRKVAEADMNHSIKSITTHAVPEKGS
jgi:hypothetical protein